MQFKDIRGNDKAVAALRVMADGHRVPHAILLYENPASGGLALATAFAQYLCCTSRDGADSCGHCPSCTQVAKLVHPDVHYVFPVNKGAVIKSDRPLSDEGIAAFRELFTANPYFTEQELYETLGVEGKTGNISVWEAREIISEMSLAPVAGGYKTVIFFLPERMNQECANTLLKLVEEPPSKTVFLFVTQAPQNVMPTIASRCQCMRVLPFDASQLVHSNASEEVVALWDGLQDALLARNLLAALDVADALDALKSREKQKAFCNFATEQIRKVFLCSKGLQDIAYADRPVSDAAQKVFTGKFCIRATAAFDKAALLIGRNVSAKMVFTDLVNRLYVNL